MSKSTINKKAVIITLALAMAFAITGCGGNSGADSDEQDYAYTPEDQDYAYTDEGIGYIRNVILVYFEENASDRAKDKIVEGLGGTVVGRMDTLNQYQVQVETAGYDELKALCAELEEEDAVLMATVDFTMFPSIDPYFPSEGYTDNWDETIPNGQNWGQEAIHAPDAWAYRSQLGSVDVAVVDNGFNTSHEDLQNLLLQTGYGVANEQLDHGSMVAGIIGAGFDNGIGIAGMAPNANVRCYPLGDGSSGTVPTSATMAAVINAVKDGAKVVNLSRGSSSLLKYNGDQDAYDAWGKSAALEISALLDRGYDFLIVQAAGNGDSRFVGVDAKYNGLFCSITAGNGYTNNHTASEILDHVIVVGNAYLAGDRFIQAASSNGGQQVTLCAPGESIYCTTADGYDTASGTSLAAPFVSATAALVWGADPDLTAKEVKNLLASTCREKAVDNAVSPEATGDFGMLDAGAAVAGAAHAQADDTKGSESSDGTGSPASASGEDFIEYLQEKYVEADDHVNSYPVFYDVNGRGEHDPSSGKTTWLKYAVADFDGDGQQELITYTSTLTGLSEDSPGADNGVGGYHYFESVSGEIKEVSMYTILSPFSSFDITCYDNGIMDLENHHDVPSSLNVLGFKDSFRDELGSFREQAGEYLSYRFEDGGRVTRNICSGFAVDATSTLSNADYVSEYDRIHAGKAIDVRFLDLTKDRLF